MRVESQLVRLEAEAYHRDMEKDLVRFDPCADSATAYEELDDADVTHVFGEFSFVTASYIEKAIVQSVHIGRTNVCNLLGCTYLDAAGISVLLRARRAIGPAFSIVAPDSGIVRRVLELTDVIGPDLQSSVYGAP